MVLRVEKGNFVASADLRFVEVRNHRLTPAEAEVRVTFGLRGVLAEPEVRGRLVGPRCPYASTVEVAYPFRTLPRERPDMLTARVVIPEPSLWEPACPFLYEGPLELCHKGGRGYTWRMSHGLRSVQLGRGGLRWNGQPLPLRGAARQDLPEADAAALRRAGYNTLLAGRQGGPHASPADFAALCDAADRLGFLVLTRLPATAEAVAGARGLADHACFLGWLVPQDSLEQQPVLDTALGQLAAGAGALLGVELSRPLPPERLAGFHFACCREELLPALAQMPLAKLVLTDRAPLPEGAEPGAGVLGWIHC